jgi:hypothetical protein
MDYHLNLAEREDVDLPTLLGFILSKSSCRLGYRQRGQSTTPSSIHSPLVAVYWLMVLGNAGLWIWRRVVTYHSISHTLIKPSTSSAHLHHDHYSYRRITAIFSSTLSSAARLAGPHSMASLSPQELAWPAHKVRETFLTFFKTNSHTFGWFNCRPYYALFLTKNTVPASSVVPFNDPTLLFTNAGT